MAEFHLVNVISNTRHKIFAVKNTYLLIHRGKTNRRFQVSVDQKWPKISFRALVFPSFP